MWILIIILVVAGTVAAGASLLWDKKSTIDVGVDCSTCSGDNPKCEQTCMMEAAVKSIEYFDDEELDRYAGRPAENFTDEEAEEFREVMLTMKQEELKAWNRSLILRQINMPNQIKDEFILLTQ